MGAGRRGDLGDGEPAFLVQQVAFERASPMPAESVSVYYDSYRNLAARGIIRDGLPPVAPLPRPFPNSNLTFAPDPPG